MGIDHPDRAHQRERGGRAHETVTLPAQGAIDHAAANAQNFTDLRHSHVALFKESSCGAQCVRRERCGSSAGVGTFGDGVSFQLREGGDDTEYESSARRAGVDVLLQGLELRKSVEFSTLEDSRPPRQIGVS